MALGQGRLFPKERLHETTLEFPYDGGVVEENLLHVGIMASLLLPILGQSVVGISQIYLVQKRKQGQHLQPMLFFTPEE